MRRTVIVLASLASFAAAGYSFYYFALKPEYWEPDYSLWLQLGVPVVLLLAGIAFLVWSLSDNIYNLKAGKVISHSFEKAHWTAPIHVPPTPAIGNSPGSPGVYVPPMWVEDTWCLQIEDPRGRTGWLSFSNDVFRKYPVGSHYPRKGNQPAPSMY